MFRQTFLLLMTILLCGCGVHNYGLIQDIPIPITPEPKKIQYHHGAIYQSEQQHYDYQPLFENIKAHAVGDTLTIFITEKLTAQNESKNSLSRAATSKAQIGTFNNMPSFGFSGLDIGANSGHTFDGTGKTNENLSFKGTITVMIHRVLNNGSLYVQGQTKIRTNTGTQVLRLSGIVNPRDIKANNSIESWQLSNAELAYLQRGDTADYNSPGWLHRTVVKLIPY